MSFTDATEEERQESVEGSLPARDLPFALLFAAFIVYLATLAPGLTWAHGGSDGGDLVTAAYRLGIPHPTGYPLYVLLGHLFARLPVGDVAFRLNLMSATFAALAIAGFFIWVRTEFARVAWAGRLAVAARWMNIVAVSASLLLVFSPLFWSQALIAEVYALNAFFAVTLLCLLWRWETSGSRTLLPLLFLLYGLGLGNHLTLLLLLPAFLYLIWSGPHRPRITRRLVHQTAAAFAAGGAVYLYVPWRAAADPMPNWGNPVTLGRFLWLVSGALYRRYLFGLPLAAWPPRLAAWARHLLTQFGPWGVILGVLGLIVWMSARRRVAVATLFIFGLYTVYSLGYDTSDAFVYLIPAHIIWAFWIAGGLLYLLSRAGFTLSDVTGRSLALALLLLMPLWSLFQNLPPVDLSDDREARDYIESAAQLLPEGAAVISGADRHTFTLWYLQGVEQRRHDLLVLDRDLVGYDWYREQVTTRAGWAIFSPGDVGTATWWRDLITALAARYPVALADADPQLMASFQWRMEGPFYILQAP